MRELEELVLEVDLSDVVEETVVITLLELDGRTEEEEEILLLVELVVGAEDEDASLLELDESGVVELLLLAVEPDEF